MSEDQLHVPVMEKILLQYATENRHMRLGYDATFGRGGHTASLLSRFPELKMQASDRDSEAIEYGRVHFKDWIDQGRLELHHSDFESYVAKEVGPFDFILADLGVSSPQLDSAERGFSFYHDGPLDMRMNNEAELTAETIINEFSEDELFDLFKRLGEVRSPGRVVRAICHDRKEKRYTRTRELAGLIERVDGWRKKGSHPATKYFMALRLEVNRELDQIQNSLKGFVDRLHPDGRLAILTFHSLEDRIVKHGMREMKDTMKALNKKVIVADEEEKKSNVRSRSAKLRVFQKRSGSSE